MFQKKIVLKNDTPDATYTKMCNMMEEQGFFVACGDSEDKWILGSWESETEFLAWLMLVNSEVECEDKC